MPKGGHRVGAGRKPEGPQVADVVPMPSPAEREALVRPPDDLTDEQRAVWDRFAGLAIERGTLTRHTAPALGLLCAVDVELRATKKQIDTDGRTYMKVMVDSSGQEHVELKSHPLTSHYRQLVKQSQNLMKDFMLCPFGKPANVASVAQTPSEKRRAQVRAQFFGGAVRA